MVELESDRRQAARGGVLLALPVRLDAGLMRDHERRDAGQDQRHDDDEGTRQRMRSERSHGADELRQGRSVVGLCGGFAQWFAQSFTTTITRI